jgi:hypothetical protein
MLEARVEELEKQLVKEFQYNKILVGGLGGYMRKEAAEKEAEIEAVSSEEVDSDEED